MRSLYESQLMMVANASYGDFFASGKVCFGDGVITVKLSHDVPNVGGFGGI
ncbi:hypothetical protein NXW27_21060 [Phocaeicola dorei]|nr:hypothetical protein [Phocaeicola dorei]